MRKSLTLFLLATVALTLGGCVYLRLFELKKQLAHFDENFKTDTAVGFAIQCLHPVLLGDDLRWLGAEPKKIVGNESEEAWSIRWVKEPPPALKEYAVYDVEVDARLVEGRLAEVRIPERFFAYFPKELFLNLLRSAGTAKVDRSKRSTEGQTEAITAAPMPDLGTIVGMLGQPTSQRQDEATTLYLYRYRADTATAEVKPIEVTFIFDTASGQLRRLTGKLPRGTLNFDFTKTPQNEKSPGRS